MHRLTAQLLLEVVLILLLCGVVSVAFRVVQ
jgi:hypothetical protein